ncbi:MAG TPA: GAP family protein [Candidatus Saccharimonadales bacterium]|nr:GAP family protein [Candidatus Saccharimonadales bacterium]
MSHVFLIMAGLGLAAVDPIGIALMPLLLMQKQPLQRSLAFLGGSLLALMVMGVAFAWGLGLFVLHAEQSHPWLVPYSQVAAGTVLLAVATGMVIHRRRHSQAGMQPPQLLVDQLRLKVWHIATAGAALVVAQSIADVVFVVAMVHVGQQHWPLWLMASAVLVYSLAALVLQIAVVGVYYWLPAVQRGRAMEKLRRFVDAYAELAAICASSIIAIVLLAYGLPASLHYL